MPDLSSASLGSGPLPAAQLFSSAQRAALDALIAEAEDGTGCAALIGEAGTGKTAVLDTAAALLGHPPVQVIRVGGGGAPLTSKRLIAQIIGSEADDEAAEAIEQALERLLMPASPWTRTILMVDDAHALERDALAYLQLMCGLQAPDANSLQIVFAGRPEFWSLLESEHLRSLRERIRVRPILPRPVPPPLIEPPDTASDVPTCGAAGRGRADAAAARCGTRGCRSRRGGGDPARAMRGIWVRRHGGDSQHRPAVARPAGDEDADDHGRVCRARACGGRCAVRSSAAAGGHGACRSSLRPRDLRGSRGYNPARGSRTAAGCDGRPACRHDARDRRWPSARLLVAGGCDGGPPAATAPGPPTTASAPPHRKRMRRAARLPPRRPDRRRPPARLPHRRRMRRAARLPPRRPHRRRPPARASRTAGGCDGRPACRHDARTADGRQHDLPRRRRMRRAARLPPRRPHRRRPPARLPHRRRMRRAARLPPRRPDRRRPPARLPHRRRMRRARLPPRRPDRR